MAFPTSIRNRPDEQPFSCRDMKAVPDRREANSKFNMKWVKLGKIYDIMTAYAYLEHEKRNFYGKYF